MKILIVKITSYSYTKKKIVTPIKKKKIQTEKRNKNKKFRRKVSPESFWFIWFVLLEFWIFELLEELARPPDWGMFSWHCIPWEIWALSLLRISKKRDINYKKE